MSRHPDPGVLRELDAVEPERRGELLDHVAACESCRERMLSEDPTRVFGLLSRRAIPEDLLDEVSAAVTEGIDSGRRVSLSSRVSRRVWAVGAWAAVILLAAALFLIPRGGRDDTTQRVATFTEPTPRAMVTILDSPGESQVVDLALGETQVVMIFDQELEL